MHEPNPKVRHHLNLSGAFDYNIHFYTFMFTGEEKKRFNNFLIMVAEIIRDRWFLSSYSTVKDFLTFYLKTYPK